MLRSARATIIAGTRSQQSPARRERRIRDLQCRLSLRGYAGRSRPPPLTRLRHWSPSSGALPLCSESARREKKRQSPLYKRTRAEPTWPPISAPEICSALSQSRADCRHHPTPRVSAASRRSASVFVTCCFGTREKAETIVDFSIRRTSRVILQFRSSRDPNCYFLHCNSLQCYIYGITSKL